jgi:hypothetical protein
VTPREFAAALQRRALDALWARAAAPVRSTAPVGPGPLPLMVLSMVHHRDVLRYLVAAKSFLARVPAAELAVVCDPTLTADDRATLRRHLPHLQLHEASAFAVPGLPTGGCWERLLAIGTMAASRYVIQLDADTLTLGPLPEVRRAVEQGTGFVLGEEAGQVLRGLPEVSATAREWMRSSGLPPHVQDRVEADFADAGLPADARYVRGCAGFTGFPRDATLHGRLLDFAHRMAARHGPAWRAWGTEQISSNYLVANAHGTQVLPYPRYTDPREITVDTVFVHYIGWLRHRDRGYERLTRRVLRSLAGDAVPTGIERGETT